tara:strand:- start:20 stop:193 length:174 start_codon:yes stop_codon:yes gene_type:complete
MKVKTVKSSDIKKHPTKRLDAKYWIEHNKWLSGFADAKIIYPKDKPVKRKRGTNAKR